MNYLKFGINFALALHGTLALSAARLESTDESPNLAQVKIEGATMAGTGCANGIGASVHLEGSTLVTEARELGAIASRQHRRTDSRESCQFIIDLAVPAGWTYAADRVSGSLKAFLGTGAKARADFAVWFGPGQLANGTLLATASGSSSTGYSIGLGPLIYAPCTGGRSLKVKAALNVDRGSRTDTLAAAEFTGPVRYNLRWKRCTSRVVSAD